MRVVPLTAAEVRPLRQAVLRPHERAEDLVWPGDDAPGAAHLGAVDEDGALHGVASIAPEPHPHAPAEGDWRLRGMATAPEARGRGAGALLLEACLEHARSRGARRVWCNARAGVLGFYERAGFVAEGEPFELPGIGLHTRMTLDLQRRENRPLGDSR